MKTTPAEVSAEETGRIKRLTPAAAAALHRELRQVKCEPLAPPPLSDEEALALCRGTSFLERNEGVIMAVGYGAALLLWLFQPVLQAYFAQPLK